jgi:hypothetical protein
MARKGIFERENTFMLVVLLAPFVLGLLFTIIAPKLIPRQGAQIGIVRTGTPEPTTTPTATPTISN